MVGLVGVVWDVFGALTEARNSKPDSTGNADLGGQKRDDYEVKGGTL